MQIKLFKIKNNFKKKNLELNPYLYWKLIVLSAIVLTTVSFIFGYYTFMQTQDDSAASIENAIHKKPIEKERIEKVLDYFLLREKKSAQIINSPSPVVDPSL